MRRKLLKTLARSARRAALLTTLSLAVALAIGVGGFAASPDAQHAIASVLPGTGAIDTPAPPATFARVAGPTALAHSSTSTSMALSEQAFETSRPSAPSIESPVVSAAEDVVRASRLVTPESGTPPLRSGDRVRVSVSFYYCALGAASPARGDGGGFCGAMRDGSVVYNGAAACDVVYLGQRFRIEGDPLGRIYRCADTGSAVHGLHRDIWFGSSDEGWTWQRSVGQAATIEVLP